MKRTPAKRKVSRKSRPMARPTQIPISRRTRNVLLIAGVLLLLFVMWTAPSVPIIALGGFALALIISFPVRALSNFMPRGLAILISFLSLAGLIVFAIAILVPILIDQLAALVAATPEIARMVDGMVRNLLLQLADRGLLPGTPEEFISDLGEDLFNRAQALAQTALGGLVGFVSGAFNVGIALFGMVFIAAYLLVDVRRIKAAYLRCVPVHYRRDARDLWNAFGFSLSRYLSGLSFILIAQGVLSAIALTALGVPYAILLGAWVSVTAIIPYLGAWLGAIPAVIVAFFVSPLTALLTALLFLAIQQFESNVLTPRIQGQAVRVHPILILLAVIAGGEIGGLLGVILAVPAVAVFRVLFDFFRVRLRTEEVG
jgi:predicted PurR-regulated permease PerM